ncbi:plasmid stabilization protein [Inquilinus sp. NPDC058860]|uniref:plasmid stabilization protein n=1 Tax=Inquilinus sp. NPDC058860 TaxID=3346652 RepID=UPI0036CC235F
MIGKRDAEAEIGGIPEGAAEPEDRIKLGTLLAEIGRASGLTDEDFAVFEQVRDRTPAEPLRFDTGGPDD